MNWQAFQSDYSRSNRGSSRQEVSRAWADYKERRGTERKSSPRREGTVESEATMFDKEPMPRIEVSYAVRALEQVRSFGYAGLRAYTLLRTSSTNLEPEGDESAEELVTTHASICFNGARYIRMWLGEERLTSRSDDTKLAGVREVVGYDFSRLVNGVYYLELEGREVHFFVWIVSDTEIVYGGSYGGVCSLSVVRHDRREYLRRFRRAMEGSLEDYAFVFDVEPVVSSVGFRSLVIQRSRIYV